MPLASPPRRIVLLSMGFSGKDGVSAVTRQALDALEGHARRAGCALETWRLFEAPAARAGLVRTRMGRAGRARLMACFTPERFGERFLHALGLAGEATPCAA